MEKISNTNTRAFIDLTLMLSVLPEASFMVFPVVYWESLPYHC